jgi:hypothetical protein
MIVATLAATGVFAKTVFLILCIFYLVMQYGAMKREADIETYRITKP